MNRVLLLVLLLLGLGVNTASPVAAEHCGSGLSEEVCVEGQGAGFDLVGTQGQSGSPDGIAEAGFSDSGGPLVLRQARYAPTCTGNSATAGEVLCGAALTCPDETEVRFWRWQREQVDGVWGAWALVDTVCLGPEDPVIDPGVAIPAIVQRDFQRVVVMRGTAEVSPRPDTLVNVATRFRTDAPASYDIPLQILGQSVVITARAQSYDWHFGDGQSAVSQAPGGYVEHVYTQAAPRQAHVVITWSGSFRVNGGASQPIAGTVRTTGDPVTVEVRQARSELVGG